MTERQIEAIEARVRELERDALEMIDPPEVERERLVARVLAELARAMRAVQEGTL